MILVLFSGCSNLSENNAKLEFVYTPTWDGYSNRLSLKDELD